MTSLYIHLPFCVSKCAYCDFNSIVADEQARMEYLQALTREVARTGSFHHERRFETIYFGGGTPTIYQPEQLCRLLAAIHNAYDIAPQAEITVEANPGTVTAEGLTMLRETGFNRLSLGVQSLDEKELRMLGRGHSVQQAREALAAARAAGFDNLSVDLINCLPGQAPETWQRTLEEVIFWLPEHISCYGLSLEKGTPLTRRMTRQQQRAGKPAILQACDESVASQIYEETHWTLTESGYEHYEISNYARSEDAASYRCRHNENYWRHGEYLGLGAGATSYLNGHRIKSEPNPLKWTDLVLAGVQPSPAQREALDDEQRALETLMLALRTSDGLDLGAFCREFGFDRERYELRIRALIEARLAEAETERLVLTPIEGFLLHSEIVQMFM